MTNRYPDSADDFPADSPEAAAGGGCCSNYVFPPLVIVVIAAAILGSGFRDPTSLPALTDFSAASGVTSPTAPISPIFTPEVQFWGAPIGTWAAQAALDPNLVAVVMQIESCGDPRALSRSGAIGLFQVMPYHFAADDAPYLPNTNAARGLAYLQRALEASSGDPRLAFAGYNGGLSVIALPEWAWAAETVRYAYWGSGIYADARADAMTSPRLSEWLSAGGASLCRAARQRLNLSE